MRILITGASGLLGINLALEAAKLWAEIEPDRIDAHQVAAAMYVRTGQTELARSHLEKLLQLSENGQQDGFNLVTALLSKESDKKTALNVMSQLVATRQDNPKSGPMPLNIISEPKSNEMMPATLKSP